MDRSDDVSLLWAYLADDLNEEHQLMLQQRLKREPELRQLLLELASDEGAIVDWVTKQPDEVTPLSAKRSAKVGEMVWSRWLVAATLLGVLGFTWLSRRPAQPSPLGEVARWTRLVDCRWAGEPPSGAGGQIYPGQTYQLLSGIAEIEFSQGAKVAFRDATTLTVGAMNHMTLGKGKISAYVPPEAVGFTVNTPSGTIVDRGTEFCVEVTQDTSEVHVLGGEVELPTAFGDQADGQTRPRKLFEGQAVRLRSNRVDLIPASFEGFIGTYDTLSFRKRLAVRETFSTGSWDQQVWEPYNAVTEAVTEVVDEALIVSKGGGLVTRKDFDPVALGGVTVRMRWKFLQFPNEGNELSDNLERIDIYTRSETLRSPPARDGRRREPRSGIQFNFGTRFSRPMIRSVSGDIRLSNLISSGSLDIRVGDEVQIEISDDGLRLSFQIRNLTRPDQMAMVAATVQSDTSDRNQIVIHDRFHHLTKSKIDDIEIWVGDSRPRKASTAKHISVDHHRIAQLGGSPK